MVKDRVIMDLPITSCDVQHALAIFGKNLATVRGSTVRRRPEHADVEEDYAAVPRSVVEGYKNIIVSADVFL